MATGVDLIEAAVLAAVGERFDLPATYGYDGVWAELVLFAEQAGRYNGLHIDVRLRPFIVEEDVWVDLGDFVHQFTGANEAIGTIVFRFSSRAEADEIWSGIRKMVKVDVVR